MELNENGTVNLESKLKFSLRRRAAARGEFRASFSHMRKNSSSHFLKTLNPPPPADKLACKA